MINLFESFLQRQVDFNPGTTAQDWAGLDEKEYLSLDDIMKLCDQQSQFIALLKILAYRIGFVDVIVCFQQSDWQTIEEYTNGRFTENSEFVLKAFDKDCNWLWSYALPVKDIKSPPKLKIIKDFVEALTKQAKLYELMEQGLELKAYQTKS